MADPLGDLLQTYGGDSQANDYSGYEDFYVEGKKVGIYNPKLGSVIAGDPRGAKAEPQQQSGDPLGDMISGVLGSPTPPPEVDTSMAPKPSSGPMDSLKNYGKSVFGWKDYPNRATLLPMAEDEQKNLHFAMPQAGIDILNSVLLPGFAAKGGKYNYGDTLGLAAMASPMSAAGRAGELTPAFATPGLKTPKVPTTGELKAAADTGYTAARNMGVTYTADSVKSMADGIANALNAEGRIGESNPELFALLGKLQAPPKGSFATLDALQSLRSRLGDIAGSPDHAKSAAASIAIRKLDGFIQHGRLEADVPGAAMAGPLASETPGLQAASGDPQRASTLLGDARGNSAAAFRADRLAKLRDLTELRASAGNSGHNLGNVIRQRLATFLSTPSKTRGFSDKELDAMRQVVQGTASTNTLREVSNLLGGGGGLGQTFLASLGGGIGAMTGGYEGAMIGAAVPALTGSAARAGANALTKRQLTKVEEMVRSRSPVYAARAANPQMRLSPPFKAELARRLGLLGATQGGLLVDPQPDKAALGLLD